MGWFSKKPEEKLDEKNWLLVKRMESTVTWRDSGDTKTLIHYYMYESDDGARKVDFKQSGENIGMYNSKSHPFYCDTIFMWLEGEDHNDIPSYWEKSKDQNEKYINQLYERILRSVKEE